MSLAKQLRWDRHFLEMAKKHSEMSKDPSTKTGAVLVGPDLEVRSMGYNGFARGVADLAERLADRPMKYKLTIHAERNAVLLAARSGTPTIGCTLYVAATEVLTGRDWGGPPCIECAKELIQAGVLTFVYYKKAFSGAKWGDEEFAGLDLVQMREAGVSCREIEA